MNPIIEAVKTFGKDNQCKIAIEEMSELTKEICKNFRGENNVTEIAEEIADVKIMLEQLEVIFCCYHEVFKWYRFKMHRLERIIQYVQHVQNEGENHEG